MASATAAYLMPHPPIIVPAVARDELRHCSRTHHACTELGARIAALAPHRVVLVSPHAPRLSRAAPVYATPRIAGSLARFGVPHVAVDLPGDPELVAALTAPGTGYAAIHGPIDHGALVPLWFLAEAGWNGPTAVLGLPALAGRDELRWLGESLAAIVDGLAGTTVYVASGDMSHRVTPGAPAGYDPRAASFDLACRDLIAQGDLGGLLEVDDDLREAAAEDVVDPVLLVASATGFVSRGAHVLSYEHPFGVGYLVAALNEAGVPAGKGLS
jgi:aromatic ring-opening dioxygenase LigB subunit